MVIGVLGPLVVTVNGTSVVPSAAKPRQVLALLAANLGRHVSMAAMAEELWDGDPPGRPSGVVQTYVKQLRRGLSAAYEPVGGPDGKDVLVRSHTGYILDPPEADVDVDAREFERLALRGQRALAEDEVADAARILVQALTVWRGPALADVRTGPVLETEVRRLDEVRRGALESRIAADLRLGRHAELVSELTVLTTRYPLQENLHAQLILTLYRCGRSWQALEVFRKLRASFVREIGIEPSQRLQRLHHAILADDPSLASPAYDLAVF
ncbi:MULTISPECIES: AfsR/SARP family transcriptional regulator [unclassified Streptomyces]|uniref:AfsR/SARP family transcriptional regulator n=1 Tax=unclassified Streptomyces TaxID=2593676 RepID=UPI0022509DD2|nr:MULTISPECIES: AfsR/SARP family transcriptional regulator [unclassified Streptomyces]MCX5141896.1 AfsR/SARP family transcriptional regulator [Streptomyces sp. NBC_00338]WRZ66371.1 AfsR/SARP family transcriptional regulator [Streptomyces sp. NBC_01257]WSU60365.1 AfsR/SARP family transcriptional regulator [Streptomyces sp. NBC_01104]